MKLDRHDPQAGAKQFPLPFTALFVLSLFLPAQSREAVLGDAEERLHSDAECFGVDRATWLLRWDVLRTAVVYTWRVVKTPALPLAGAIAGAVWGR